MESLIPEPPMRALCRMEEIPDGQGKGFPAAPGGFTGLVVVRRGDQVWGYTNSCPHIGTPLDWTPDRFMSSDGQYLICATHGAAFSVETGKCLRGPCVGDSLESVVTEVREGVIYVPHDAGL